MNIKPWVSHDLTEIMAQYLAAAPTYSNSQ